METSLWPALPWLKISVWMNGSMSKGTHHERLGFNLQNPHEDGMKEVTPRISWNTHNNDNNNKKKKKKGRRRKFIGSVHTGFISVNFLRQI